ncbi:hypothetical protein PTSG_12427 [Salpingoeca rosetta]|uniref:Glycosyltransferase 2-like domain-containing protein n=1 Tax=Salpingoeca rosetta (strain ATCC 50818 / BSB-021) TaxID=946362 RepID=F2UCJ2_SALR5|nr:uncharacterized protein PTSG_12427 [Salpingoeca rosetta]EGD74299.1 hypothetical protein PTSG_12427 [Salpingoeca rosetta]|eukprot:XP_004993199.1 hypothetical protein PTSG_12427 [Salpingoeca rosetta]
MMDLHCGAVFMLLVVLSLLVESGRSVLATSEQAHVSRECARATAPHAVEHGGSETIFGIMITGKDVHREALAQLAADAFHNQTYPSKVLIIVNTGNFTLNPHPCQHEIRASADLKLGTLRNMGISAVPTNATWVQWDDDDWRPKHALQSQYHCMTQAHALGCVLERQWQVALHQNSTFLKRMRPGIMGTLMLRATPATKELRYPQLARQEDSLFLRDVREVGTVHICDNHPDWYFRLLHGHNTWGAAHFHLDLVDDNTWCGTEPLPPSAVHQPLPPRQARLRVIQQHRQRRAVESFCDANTTAHTRHVFQLYQHQTLPTSANHAAL